MPPGWFPDAPRPAISSWRFLRRALACLALALLGPALGVPAFAQKPAGGSLAGTIRMLVHTPYPEEFDLALDEIELDWSGMPGAKSLSPGFTAVAIAGTRPVDRAATRATIATTDVTTIEDLIALGAALESANPGAEAHLVLYVAKRDRGESTRRLLTREVGVLLAPQADPQAILSGVPASGATPVPGVPGGYVLRADDPKSALDLAAALRRRPGVKTAYPLLKARLSP
jgi:hypothetical protein